MSSYEDWKFTQSRLYTMKLKCNWLIHLRYILEPPLEPIQAHIELQMSSYENEKAIKLIALFVGFAPLKWHYIKDPGPPLVFKYKSHKAPASDRLRTGLEEHHLTFGATLELWRSLGIWITELRFAQKWLDLISDTFCNTRFYLLKLVFIMLWRFGKVGWETWLVFCEVL